jgi:hypothetical protein
MDNDQVKEIIGDLRSRGLSYREISNVLRESYSIIMTHEKVRQIFKTIQSSTIERAEPISSPDANILNQSKADRVVPEGRVKINEAESRNLYMRSKKEMERIRKEEKDRSILESILVILLLIGLIFLLMWASHWSI